MEEDFGARSPPAEGPGPGARRPPSGRRANLLGGLARAARRPLGGRREFRGEALFALRDGARCPLLTRSLGAFLAGAFIQASTLPDLGKCS